MSSTYVRDQLKAFIGTDLVTENLIDLTGEYRDVDDVIAGASLTFKDPWLGIQFVGSQDIPITVAANNIQGLYREIGTVMLHIVEMASSTSTDDILTRSETIQDAFRGQRINDIIVEEVTPPNFEQGATLDFESGYVAATIILSYERDLNL